MPEITQSEALVFFVNGKKVVDEKPDPEETLLSYLRNKLGLTGTKLGCAEGGCGACTVMVSRFDRVKGTLDHMSINACLAPVCSMHGLAVTTVEGIGSTKTKLHPVQESMAKSHGSQCGFCTPGFIMSVYALMRKKYNPSEEELEVALQGNLCRCTGYRPIVEGFRSLLKQTANSCATGATQCCKNIGNGACCQTDSCSTSTNQCCKKLGNGACCQQEVKTSDVSTGDVTQASAYVPSDDSQEPIFPSELQINAEDFDTRTLLFQSDRVTWYRPSSLRDLLLLKDKHPDARIVVGNTEIGIEIKFKNMLYPVIIAATHIAELKAVEYTETGISFGASVTLTTLDETLKEAMRNLDESKTRVFAAIVEMLQWFAGPQIRNAAAIGGNIVTASPISDLNPLLQAAGCTLTLASHGGGLRQVQMDEKFFAGYRKTVLNPTEVLLNIHIPFTTKSIYFQGFKQAQRRDDDIAIVNAGMKVVIDETKLTIQDIALSFGGMAPTTVMAVNTAKQLVGRHWDDTLVSVASKLLLEELPLPGGTPGGMEAFRCSLTLSFFYKFYLAVRVQLERERPTMFTAVTPESYKSAFANYHRPPSAGVQLFEQIGDNQHKLDAVGRPLPHLSAEKHTTGEAVYVDDLPIFREELNLALVVSTKAHADILDIDTSAALSMPGVVDFISFKDVPNDNMYGVLVPDEEIFASKTVTCQGQVIGAILAETKVQAQRAAKAVKISYDEKLPIITIEQAIEAGSFFGQPQTLKKGDIAAAFQSADHVLEGQQYLGGQEHFYLETQACIAVPKGEDGEMEVFVASQGTTIPQEWIARTLGVDQNKICCRVKRLGGGFGGKEIRWAVLGLPVAVAAHKCKRPVRAMFDRDEDMITTGGRHPFLGKYKVGFSKSGKILALELDLYQNCGNTMDISSMVLQRAIFHCDNCYSIPNISVTGYECKTNIPSNTSFRGFGAPQAVLIMENIVSDIAKFLQISALEAREVNLYREGDLTHFNQPMTDDNIRRCWSEVIRQSDFEQRQLQVEKFNRENRWKKRGLCVLPVKHGIGFGCDFMQQGAALVHIYTDGSVLLYHGGAEMGQGLHTKMVQIASRVLSIPMSYIHVSETSSSAIPNAVQTAGSVSSDLCGMAVQDACQSLVDRLAPYMKSDPDGGWKDWVKKAYFDRVNLSATGFYKSPDLSYNPETNCGQKYLYFTVGAACTEVEVDCLTGDHTVLRTDIVMDVGKSLNPAIDIGQIEGAFIQGYGLFVLEELKYTPSGYLLSRGPGVYKIPSCSSIPITFNVTLLKDSINTRAVYSSKGIGEPPLGLASSVFFAIKYAIDSARRDSGITENFGLDSPATAERIRMACVDHLTSSLPEYKTGTFTPWFVRRL